MSSTQLPDNDSDSKNYNCDENQVNEILSMCCACCHEQYAMGYYNFHNLCDSCFNQFDNQKMKGRFGQLREFAEQGGQGQYEQKPEPDFYTESSIEFIKSGKCNHSVTTNKMQNVIDFIKTQVKNV